MRFFSKPIHSGLTLLAVCFLVQMLLGGRAWAVPSYARQTGLACEACHTVFPELTHFGRLFKLFGYTLENVKDVSDINMQKSTTLSLTELPPISAMFEATITNLKKSLPDTGLPSNIAQNNTIGFPSQASLFFAGRIAPNFGAFSQMTYTQAGDSFEIDNTDLRFASETTFGGSDLIYGLSLNNNPTVQDPWNSTPAWGFPFVGTDAAPGPFATQIDGSLAQNVAGATVYAMLDRQYYGEFGIYRSAQTGTSTDGGVLDSTAPAPVITGVAPYWRLAWEHDWGNNSVEVGTYGLAEHAKGANAAVTGGPTDRYLDVAFDTQYQYIGDTNLFTLTATWIHEKEHYKSTADANNSDSMNTVRATATYYYQHRYGGSIELFRTSGTTDSAVYAPASLTGSNNGSPKTTGETFEVDYVPWLNTKIGAQYTIYQKFNGDSTNYDGFGRNAHDNNTLLFSLWTAF